MRWVWAALFLMAVAVGSLLVWQGFGTNDEGPFHSGGYPGHGRGMRNSTSPGIQAPARWRRSEAEPSLDRRGGRNAVSWPEGKVLAVFGKAPEFTLTERSGRPLSKNDLAGKPWIADFIFTSCAGQCPLMSLQMKRFQTLFPAGTGLRFVSFTVDPERDKPEVLASYADRYGAERERWLFLTGQKQEINRILKEFFLSPVEEPAMHSIRFILVDPEGKIRGYYDSSDPGSMNQLIHDAQLLPTPSLLRGGPQGRGSPDAAGVRTNKDSFNRPFQRKGRSNPGSEIASASLRDVASQ